MPTEEQLRLDFLQWFKEQYGIPAVETSSTGLPAVHFALHILQRYAPLIADAGEP